MLQTCNWSRHISYHQKRHENDGQFSLSGTIANSFCYTNKTPTFYPSKQLKIIYTTYFLAFGNLRCKAFLSSKEITQCNTGETVLYVPVNSKTAHHPPPPPLPDIIKFPAILLDGEMPHPLELQRVSNPPPPSRHVKAIVQNIFFH